MHWVHRLTGTGDLAVLVPLIAILSVWLLVTRQPAALCWWWAAVAICAGATAMLKVYFYICPPSADFHSPSGHTSLSTLVYGALTLLISRSVIGPSRYAIVLLGTVFIVSIGTSRLLLHVHSLPEVLVGWLIGSLTLWIFARAYRRREYPYLRTVIVTCSIALVSLTGQEVRAEDFLHALGIQWRDLGMRCITLGVTAVAGLE